ILVSDWSSDVCSSDLGLLHLDGDSRVREYEEKPTISSRVSMGIYVMEPEVIELVPEGEYFDFPDLVRALLKAGEPVGAYDHTGRSEERRVGKERRARW